MLPFVVISVAGLDVVKAHGKNLLADVVEYGGIVLNFDAVE